MRIVESYDVLLNYEIILFNYFWFWIIIVAA